MGASRVVALVCFALAGCGLFPDVSTLTGHDAAIGDAIATNDSGDAAGAGFCASSSHVFCDDFDEGGAYGAPFTSAQIDPHGAIALATNEFMSSPNSLLTTMARRGATDAFEYADVEKDLDGWHHTVVDFDFYSDAITWQAGDKNAGVFLFYFYSDASANGDGFALSMAQMYTSLGTPSDLLSSTDHIVTGAWVHAHFDADPVAGTVALTFGGVSIDGTYPPLTKGGSPSIGIRWGIAGYNLPAPAYSVYYDNITVDYLN